MSEDVDTPREPHSLPPPIRPHPAKFTPAVLEVIERVLLDNLHDYPVDVLDPFAGVGGVFALEEALLLPLGLRCWAMELEWEWAVQSPVRARTAVGDALELMKGLATSPGAFVELWTARDPAVPALTGPLTIFPREYHAVVTSPVYGNKMGEVYDGRKGGWRSTYLTALGRKPSEGSSCLLQWTGRQKKAYQDFHCRAWELAVALLVPGGVFVLNVKDHYRVGQIQKVSLWHARVLAGMGLEMVAAYKVPVEGMRAGANRHLRVDHEMVYVFKKGPGEQQSPGGE